MKTKYIRQNSFAAYLRNLLLSIMPGSSKIIFLFLLSLVQPSFLQACLNQSNTLILGMIQATGSERDSSELVITGISSLDSLISRADSLARAADSLARLVDSLSFIQSGKEKPEKAQPDKSGGGEEEQGYTGPWEGSFGMGLTLNRGNSRQQALVSDLEIGRRGERTRFNSRSSFANTSAGNGEKTDKGNFMSKFELKQSQSFFYFSSLDLDYDHQAGIDFRISPGVGVGIAAFSSSEFLLNLNLGANTVTEYPRDRPNLTRVHYLAGQDLQVRFSDRTRLDQSITYKPRFDRMQEYLVNFSVSLTNQLTSNFILKLNLESKYDSHPPEHDPPYKREDWMFYTTINYNIW